MAYATPTDFAAQYPSTVYDTAALTSALEAASAAVDGLTFGRIRRTGFTALTMFQQHEVIRAVCAQARFVLDWGTFADSPLASYGVNGVSMSWREGAVLDECGVSTTSEVKGYLVQSGLAYRGCGV